MSFINDALEVWEAYQGGHDLGTIINDYVVQPICDHYEMGSGPAGETYINFIDEHNIEPLDWIPDNLE